MVIIQGTQTPVDATGFYTKRVIANSYTVRAVNAGYADHTTAGVVVDEETLALDVVEELGPTGSYLGHEHTIRHFKEPFYSKLIDKNPFSVWQKRGGLTMEARASKMVDDILAKHKTEPLSEDVKKAIHEVVLCEQAWIDKQK